MADRKNWAEEEIKYKGKTMLLREWATALKLNYKVVKMRYMRGARDEKLFAPTITHPKPVDIAAYLGEEDYAALAAIADYLQMSPPVVARALLVKAIKEFKPR